MSKRLRLIASAIGSGGPLIAGRVGLRSVPACRDLRRDISSIGEALRLDARGTLPAPRDFRLTADDARRLGGHVRAGGLLATFRRSLVSFARPVGASMAALGIVGLLVGSASLSVGGAALAPSGADTVAPLATSAPAEVQSGGLQTTEPKSSPRAGAFQPEATADVPPATIDTTRDLAVLDANPVVLLLAGSVALLVVGLALVAIAFRRSRGGPQRGQNP